MAVKPMVRNNICINSFPEGCLVSTKRQIAQVMEAMAGSVKAEAGAELPKLALVVGCSGGYGLSSRIAAAFGYGAATVGVSFEKVPGKGAGTPGYYGNLAFGEEAEKAGIPSQTLNGDAFSDEVKAETAAAVKALAAKAGVPAKIDLFVYSLASPVRLEPASGILYKSVIKPIGPTFRGKTLNVMSGGFGEAQAEPATETEIADTVKVMGGEDWELWMRALEGEGLLSPQTRSVAYTYIGPEHSWPIYKNGTIGRAKEDLERACAAINKTYAEAGKIGRAWVSVNKAVVTRASAVIPIIPLYVSCLFKVMKERGLHEGCPEQIVRLYRERLYAKGSADPGKVAVDEAGRIRLDDREMRDDVQKAVLEKMAIVTEENVFTETDVAGFRHDFLEVHGFDVEGVNYEGSSSEG
ncbi:MAG: trans-2-enoyl-CoA reductase family protein [Treponema sp.]|nr:trans-2-enoyl-CoA reductase family protein [Treponema sp.]